VALDWGERDQGSSNRDGGTRLLRWKKAKKKKRKGNIGRSVPDLTTQRDDRPNLASNFKDSPERRGEKEGRKKKRKKQKAKGSSGANLRLR